MHRPAALDAAREPIAVAKHLGDKIRPLAGFDHGAFAKVPLSCDSGKVFDVVTTLRQILRLLGHRHRQRIQQKAAIRVPGGSVATGVM